MLAKFNNKALAEHFSHRTEKMSAIILGNDKKYWVVTLLMMEKLLKQGYELAE